MQIFDTRKPMSVLFVLGTAIVIILSFWGVGFQFIKGDIRKTLDRNFESWKEKEPFSYSYKVQNGCMLIFSSNVLVIDGIALFEHENEHDFEITIYEMFNIAKKGITQAASIELKYDSMYFFPTSIKVDWDKDIHDDECFYYISNFKVIE
ncbi:DUF6174 domain-containing protein [Pseudoalteromonas sp. MTN2-4]|uniref:DUF6174 domain-containing protein n=1 Tax=Pseudoalteromonas sp. MTN2-4 TaxID=3056555 RepID=UPI0036F3F641